MGEVVAYFVDIVYVFIFVASFIQIWALKIEGSKKIEALLMYIPLIVISLIDYYWYHQAIYEQYAGFILLNLGLVHSFITTQLIICSLTKMKFPKIQIPVLLLALASLLNHYYGSSFSAQQVFNLFFGVSLINIAYILYFLRKVINQIARHLGIYCFSLEKRPKAKTQ